LAFSARQAKGRRIVSAVLAWGHEVIALVRGANAITPAPDLLVHAIDFADAEALGSSMRPHCAPSKACSDWN
jgi:putative NADH-flavin reductase